MLSTKKRLLWATLSVALFSGLPAAAALEDYFVDTGWLGDRRDESVVVDVRVAPLYYLGHIEGAVRIDKAEFLSTRRGVESLIPSAAEFSALMDRYGIAPESTVVVYAEHDNPYSARLVWTLRYHGHRKAYVLDGGYEKWRSEGRAVSLLPTRVQSGTGYRCEPGPDLRADADDVFTRLHTAGAVIWDTRRRSEFDGSEVRAARGGHIPGAVHLEWTELQRDVGGVRVLRPEHEIRELLAAKGITPGRSVIAHCQTGIRSSYATLVLLGLGYGEARNYDGSWLEWAADPSLPVQLAEEVARR